MTSHNPSQFVGCSQDVFNATSSSEFCTRENWQTAVLYLAQEMESLGLASPCTRQLPPQEGEEAAPQASLDVIQLVNSTWKLIELYRSSQRTIRDLESSACRSASDRERMLASTSRQREVIELRDRAMAESFEKERQSCEHLEICQQQLKGAKEEGRRLMSVLLQRENKYSHEMRKAEQEAAKLKERLLKVLVERTEGRGGGMEASGPPPVWRSGNRSRWNTEQQGAQREEAFYKRVIEESEKRTDLALDENSYLRDALEVLTTVVQDALVIMGVENGQSEQFCLPINTVSLSSARLLEEVKTIAATLREGMKKLKKPEVISKLEEKLTLYENKLVLYEEIMQKSEGCKEKQDCIINELKVLQELSLTNFNSERTKLQTWQDKINEERNTLDKKYSELEDDKVKHITATLSIDPLNSPEILQLPRLAVERPPAWALGPVTITAHPSRPPIISSGVTLGPSSRAPSRPSSRASSRPGSQPGSRAPSASREPVAARQTKGRSPAASLVRRNAPNSSASLGRRSRPKSANLSPCRRDVISPPTVVMRRSVRKDSKSPSSDGPGSSRSLPRHPVRLNLEIRKRESGNWSKPPTPGPMSPATSDSDTNAMHFSSRSQPNYFSSLPKNRRPTSANQSRENTPLDNHF